MKQFLALVKLLFSQQYKIKPNAGKKRSSKIAIYVVLAVCFLPLIVSVCVGSYSIGTVVGSDTGVLAMLILICQGFVLIFGILSIVTNIFNGADSDRLLFLPIKATTIFLARLTVVYINETLTSALATLVLLLPFGIGAGATASFFLMLPITILVIPLLPLLLGCLIAMPISALLTKFKSNNTVKTIIQVLMFAAFFVLYLALISSGSGGSGEEQTDAEMLQNIAEQLRRIGQRMVYVHPDTMLATAMTVTTWNSWWIAFLVAMAENAALFGLVVLVSLPFYRWILLASQESGGSKKHRGAEQHLQITNKGVVCELVVTDFKRVLRNSQMGFQVCATLIIMPLVIVMLSLSMGENMSKLFAEPMYYVIAPAILVAYMSMLGIGCNVLGLYPISRENNSLYLMKSLPVPFDKILFAKVVLATALMLASNFVICIMAVIFFKIPWYCGVAMMLVMALLSFGAMCITTLMDLSSPKLGWSNFSQSLKNSKNSFMAMLIGLLCALVIGAVFTAFILLYALVVRHWFVLLLMWFVVVALCAVFSVVCYKIMVSKAAKLFAQIET